MSMPSPTSPERPRLRLVSGSASSASVGTARDAAELDPRDFDAVFRRFAPYVARIVLRLMGSASDVDDLVQEVFMEAHRGLGSVREPAALRGWLARIAVRRSVRKLRRRRLRAFLSLESLPDQDLQLDAGVSPERNAELGALYRRLSKLGAEERVVWLLRHVEEESLDDIALLCHCSKSTVQRRLRAAERHFEPEALP